MTKEIDLKDLQRVEISFPRKIIQIGFNKCATESLGTFFLYNGIEAVHGNQGELAENVNYRISHNQDPFLDYQNVIAFTDMMNITESYILEPYKHFRYIYKGYPDSFYILNTRNCNDWINSRLKWRMLDDTPLIDAYAKILNIHRNKVIPYGVHEGYVHHANVIDFFMKNRGNLIIYDIDRDKPEKLCNFLYPYYKLNPSLFPHENKRW